MHCGGRSCSRRNARRAACGTCVTATTSSARACSRSRTSSPPTRPGCGSGTRSDARDGAHLMRGAPSVCRDVTFALSNVPTRANAGDAVARSAEVVGVRPGALVAVERGDCVHVVVGQVEVEDVDVLPHPLGLHRLREDDVAQLDVPAQHDLGRGLAVLLGQVLERALGEQVAALCDRAPRLGLDAVLHVIVAQLALDQPRVQLDLVDRGDGVGLLREPLQVGDREVGDADRAGLPVGQRLLEALPRLDVAVFAGPRPVDEVEVDVVGAELGQALVQPLDGRVEAVAVVVELGGDEDLVAGQPGLRQRLADALLVAVHLRGVDVPVAGVEGRPYRLRRLLRRHLVHPEAELRDLHAIVEPDVRNLCHACGLPAEGRGHPGYRFDEMSATLQATDLAAGHGARVLFSGLDLVLAPGDVVGLVGANGAGKSTLLRMLAGKTTPEEGTVVLSPPTATVGHLPQEPDRRPGETVAAFLARRTGVARAQAEMDAAAEALGSGAPGSDDAYALALDRWLALGGADLE